MKPIATNIADFETMRKAGQTYVDKTAYFHRLVTDPNRNFFFIARPRRFGKSLGVSTLKSIFLGHGEAFEGLAIAKTDYDWTPHPVIHFNWGRVDVSSLEKFDRTLADVICDSLLEAGYAYDKGAEPTTNLSRAIGFFHARDGVGPAILIDEYDDPVAKTLADPALAETIRSRLGAIYAQFKDNTAKIRFLFVTGVSKFTKLSVFSTLSSLNDISFDAEYAAMFGYTETELDANFDEHLRAHAEKMGLGYEAYREELKRWFNGYRFSADDPLTVYNPVSINLTLVSPRVEFRATWTATGRPSMLMNFIKREGLLKIDYENGVTVRESAFDVSDIRNLKAVAMLYQTGYLTIKDYADGDYTLGVPDEEVRRDLLQLVAAQCAQEDEGWVSEIVFHMVRGEFVPFFEGLKAMYAHLPYGSTENAVHEMNFERMLKILFWSQGLTVATEDAQTGGRADLVVLHRRGTFVIELKVDSTAADALKQIREKDYAAPYRAKGLPIWAIGLAFDSKTRQLTDAAWERI